MIFSQKLCQPIVLSFVPSRENRIGLNWIRSSIDFQFSYRHGIIFPSFIFFWQNFLNTYLQCRHAKLVFLNKKENVGEMLLTSVYVNPLVYRVSQLKMLFFSNYFISSPAKNVSQFMVLKIFLCERNIWYSTPFNFGN